MPLIRGRPLDARREMPNGQRMMQYTQWLDEKKQNGSLRALRNIDAVRREKEQAGAPFINLSSNDYLSLGDDADLRK